MSEQAYRRFMERHSRRMADRRPANHDTTEPLLGRAPEIGVLGLPLPKAAPDLADIVLDLLASADDPPLGPQAQERGVEPGDKSAGAIDAPERR